MAATAPGAVASAAEARRCSEHSPPVPVRSAGLAVRRAAIGKLRIGELTIEQLNVGQLTVARDKTDDA